MEIQPQVHWRISNSFPDPFDDGGNAMVIDVIGGYEMESH